MRCSCAGSLIRFESNSNFYGGLYMHQYFVVSPNAWNDGNVDTYLQYMKSHHVVFMGWDKENKFGRMFAEARIGDRIIVAQGANRQKRSFFVGIIDSEAKEDKESGNAFTQYRDLRSFVELEVDELPFSTQCTYKEANLVTAIYQLKDNNPADAKIMRRVENVLNKFELSYTLKEVANWKNNQRVAIPALQRGLVWKPKQVEMLWDSILRGFPIGSFVITASQNNEGQFSNRDSHSEYFLLDGQQRYNAIALGFTSMEDQAKSVLWVDLLPSSKVNSSRKYWVKVTTSSHPWGYANDDNCSVLSWSRCREAIKEFYPDADPDRITLQEIGLTKTYPVEARLPVTLVGLIKTWLKNRELDSFLKNVLADLGSKKDLLSDSNNIALIENVKQLWQALHVLVNYRITANVLDNQTINDEDGKQVDNTSSLEHLFTRLNTMGSPISPYDLRYSAIKAYWSTIKEKNDELAGQYMPAAHLAILAFRLAITKLSIEANPSEVKLAEVPSIAQIRKIAAENGVQKAAIERLYDDSLQGSLQGILGKIEEKLVKQGLPPVLRTSIAMNSPDVFLLLMVMASLNTIDGLSVIGLATWIHWFTVGGNKKNVVDLILAEIQTAETSAIEGTIKKALQTAIKKGWLLEPIEASAENFDFPKHTFTPSWQFLQFEGQPWKPLYNTIAHSWELLIFSERQYFEKKFKYDPAQTDFLKDHNRPWDYDHIIPKSWMSRQGVQFGEWKMLCLEWLWNIGNFAAIPFFINRSKSDTACWTEYRNHREGLHWDEGISQMTESGLTKDEDMAKTFAFLTSRRLVTIYHDWRETVKSLCDFPSSPEFVQNMH